MKTYMKYLILILWAGLASVTVFAGDQTPLVGLDYLEQVKQRITNIDTEALKQLIAEEPDLVIIDVRQESEVNGLGGMINGRREIILPRGWLEFRMPNEVADFDTPIVVYCGINQRSPLAADTLMQMGYTHVKNYADGFFNWRNQGYPVKFTDYAVDSMLFKKPEKVIDGVWSAIGATSPGTYTNSGHNNNLSFIVGSNAVMVFNAGDNYLLAKALHDEIKKITALPVKYVVLENGQGHAMLGSNYWTQQGVPILAHVETAAEIKLHGDEIIERMRNRAGEKARFTELATPDVVFEDKYTIDLGAMTVELLNLGPSHSPGDIVAWLPEQKLVISGDMAFHQRLLPIFDETNTAAWIETWDEFSALEAEIVIPGHGVPTNMEEVTKYTRDYLVYLREKIGVIVDEGGDLQEAYDVDQSRYAHLDTFYELSRLNADQVFRAMEFE
ncbi:MAG: glyoxylase-like metal-dependent hydrolase (beta-lactamase superfamily II) [Gammaproteobacteria bacterium]|jgi:glyoxylase-like metal-dependent hydrolase (beta-lactamase superfamily II)/rhodanese-related sulfurtransferase